jgi:hypothetical protein
MNPLPPLASPFSPTEDFNRHSQRLEQIFSELNSRTPPSSDLVAEGADILSFLSAQADGLSTQVPQPYVLNRTFHCRIEPEHPEL